MKAFPYKLLHTACVSFLLLSSAEAQDEILNPPAALVNTVTEGAMAPNAVVEAEARATVDESGKVPDSSLNGHSDAAADQTEAIIEVTEDAKPNPPAMAPAETDEDAWKVVTPGVPADHVSRDDAEALAETPGLRPERGAPSEPVDNLPTIAEPVLQPVPKSDYMDVLSREANLQEETSSAMAGAEALPAARIGRIQSIVSDALVDSNESESVQPHVAPNNRQSTAQLRLQNLRQAVSSATQDVGTGTSSDQFVSELRQEGNRTTVIDEATSRRSAVAAPARVSNSTPIGTTESGHLTGAMYQVRPGDSLWLIAQRLYGDGYRYRTLYEANRDLLSDENLLVVGQMLRVP